MIALACLAGMDWAEPVTDLVEQKPIEKMDITLDLHAAFIRSARPAPA